MSKNIMVSRTLATVLTALTLMIVGSTQVFGQSDDVVLSATQLRAERILRLLTITPQLQQIERIFANVIGHESGLSEAQAADLTAILRKHFKVYEIVTQLRQSIIGIEGVSLIPIENLLDQPLAKRARNFDVAVSMSGASEKFLDFQQKMQKNPTNTARRLILERLQRAMFNAEFAALIQTEIDVLMQLLVARVNAEPPPFLPLAMVDSQRRQRADYLVDISIDLHQFSYRFMNDRELRDYVVLMESRELTFILKEIYRALDDALRQRRERSLSVVPES